MSQEGFDLLKKECINSGLCVECGACAVVCPTGAVELKRYSWGRNPELIGACLEKECSLCHRACPAADIPLSQIEEKFFGRKRNATKLEEAVGVVRSVYTGYALDREIHDQAVSGGVISALLIYALENKIIDGAVLAGYDPDRPWIAQARLAVSKREILDCAGSKYQPHPQLLGLREAAKAGLKNIAITATPCQAAGVRKIMLDENFKEIGGRIKLVISNICAAHWSLHGTEWLIKEQLGLKLEEVAGLKYRTRPFPGIFQVKLKNGQIKTSPFVKNFLGMLGQFTPEECRVCLEKIGLTADIVVGDTWHHPVLSPELLDKYTEQEITKDERIAKAKNGLSSVVCRSRIGEDILTKAAHSGCLKLYPEDQNSAGKFLMDIHLQGKPVCNGPVVEARRRRGLPVRNYY